MSDEDQKRTEDYAHAQAQDIYKLEALASVDLHDDEERNELDASAIALLDELRDAHGDDALDDPVETWLRDALDMHINAELDMAGNVRTVRSVVVLLGTGGPHVEARTEGAEGIVVEVSWWGSHAVRHVVAPHVAGWLDSLVSDAGVG